MSDESNEQMAELELRRQRLDRELKNSRAAAAKALTDVEKGRQSLSDATRNLETLKRIYENMKTSDGVIILKEFEEVKRLIVDNTQLREKYTLEIENIKKRGKAAAEMALQLQRNLRDIEKQLSGYGRLLNFPVRKQESSG